MQNVQFQESLSSPAVDTEFPTRRVEPSEWLDELHGSEALDSLLPRADYVLLTIPHTPATEGLFGKDKFALMKSSAILVNIGRGARVPSTGGVAKNKMHGSSTKIHVFRTKTRVLFV